MKQNSSVYTLICALSMSEKRYFKVFYETKNIGSLKKYILLFDILASMKEYDDEALIKKLNKKNINTNFLSADKNYLYNLILKSLINFYSGKSIQITINESLIEIEILFYKGLIPLCLKIIEKNIALAVAIDNFPKVEELLIWKRKCVGYSQGVLAIKDINSDIENYQLIEKNFQKYNKLYFEMSLIRQESSKIRKKEVQAKIEKIIQTPEIKHENFALSISAKLKFHQVLAQYYFIKNVKIKELYHNKKQIDLLNGAQLFKQENPLDVLSIYSRYLALIRDLAPQLFAKTLFEFKEFGKLKSNSTFIQNRILAYSYMSELTFLIQNKDFDLALKLTKNIQTEISKIEPYIDDSAKMTINYLFAFVYFSFGKKKEALKYINTILNEYKDIQRPELYTWVLILNLSIHFEYKDFEYLKHINLSTNQYFSKKQKLYKVEETILRFFKVVEKQPTSVAVNNYVIELIEDLEKLRDSNFEKNALHIFDFTIWAKSFLNRQTIFEYLKTHSDSL